MPFPRVHFPLVSYSPIISIAKGNHESHNVNEITKTCYKFDLIYTKRAFVHWYVGEGMIKIDVLK